MAKYLFHASYTVEGLRGLHKDTASKRKLAVEEACKSVGGKLESLYFAFGDDDVVGIFDMPDNKAAAALSFAVTASGSVRVHITPLMTVEEIDAALMKSPAYRAPGH